MFVGNFKQEVLWRLVLCAALKMLRREVVGLNRIRFNLYETNIL